MIALVTGASSGIGAATARRLAREPGSRLVLVARREERLWALAEELGGADVIVADLTAEETPARIAREVEERHGRLDLLVNNAGTGWRGEFGEVGWENVRRHMELNFDAVVRLTEALLPLLRRSAPSAIVNVSSTGGRIGRGGTGGYTASKFALTGWTESLYLEERRHGVHVGMVLPGFIATEGFPQRELLANPLTRLVVSSPERVAEAIVDVGLRGKPERYVPRYYGAVPVLKALFPWLARRLTGGGRTAPATRPGGSAPPGE